MSIYILSENINKKSAEARKGFLTKIRKILF